MVVQKFRGMNVAVTMSKLVSTDPEPTLPLSSAKEVQLLLAILYLKSPHLDLTLLAISTCHCWWSPAIVHTSFRTKRRSCRWKQARSAAGFESPVFIWPFQDLIHLSSPTIFVSTSSCPILWEKDHGSTIQLKMFCTFFGAQNISSPRVRRPPSPVDGRTWPPESSAFWWENGDILKTNTCIQQIHIFYQLFYCTFEFYDAIIFIQG